MDPIHPIIPHPPGIGPLSSPPPVGRLAQQGDGGRGAARRERQRRARTSAPAPDDVRDGDHGACAEDEDDGRAHVDITV